MDAVSYAHSAKQAQRIESFIENPDSSSGVVTVPKVIASGETITIPEGRVAVLPNVQVDGTLNIEGEVFVPSGATFSGVVEKQPSNITVNVGTGQTYTTINQALEYLSGFYPLYKTTGVTATINLKAGFVMNEQVLVRGLNLGWITIVGEDAETIITHTALTTAFNGTHYPAFGVDKGGTSPVIGQLFRFNVEKFGGNKHGLMTYGAGSSADVLSGKGFIGAATYGIFANNGSTINASSANASNAGTIGIYATDSSTINVRGANASNAGYGGIYAGAVSTINARGANASNAGTIGIYASDISTINAQDAIVTDNVGNIAIYASGGVIDARNANAGTKSIYVYQGSIIIAQGATGALNQTKNTLTANGIIYQ